jgi:hypothetical protein
MYPALAPRIRESNRDRGAGQLYFCSCALSHAPRLCLNTWCFSQCVRACLLALLRKQRELHIDHDFVMHVPGLACGQIPRGSLADLARNSGLLIGCKCFSTGKFLKPKMYACQREQFQTCCAIDCAMASMRIQQQSSLMIAQSPSLQRKELEFAAR